MNNEKKLSYAVFGLIILLFISIYATYKITQKNTQIILSENLGNAYLACGDRCKNSEPAFVNVNMEGSGDCICIDIVDDGTKNSNPFQVENKESIQ